MVKKPFKGNYLTFEVRVSYDENTDSIHLTSKDRDIPTTNGFHLAMNGGKDAEYALRTLLEQRGMIPEERFKSIPSLIPYPETHPENRWDRFPLGIHSNGKEAIWHSSSSPNVLIIGGVGTGKSVIQRNILAHCVQNSDQWKVSVITPLSVEAASYKKSSPTVIEVATTLADGVETLHQTRVEMWNRYETLERLELNHVLDMTEPPKSLMIMIDEANWFLAHEDSRTQAHVEENELRAEAVQILIEIARLGRAAGIHFTLSSQRLNEDVLGEELLDNITTRIASGPLHPKQSKALLGNTQATQLNRTIRGRGYLQEHGKGADFQSYYVPTKF